MPTPGQRRSSNGTLAQLLGHLLASITGERRHCSSDRGLTQGCSSNCLTSLTGQADQLSSMPARWIRMRRSEEHTSELQSRGHLVCRLLLEKKQTGSG